MLQIFGWSNKKKGTANTRPSVSCTHLHFTDSQCYIEYRLSVCELESIFSLITMLLLIYFIYLFIYFKIFSRLVFKAGRGVVDEYSVWVTVGLKKKRRLLLIKACTSPPPLSYTYFPCRCCAAAAAAAFTNWVIASIVVHWSARCREWGHYELEIGWHMVLSFPLIVGSVWVYLSIAPSRPMETLVFFYLDRFFLFTQSFGLTLRLVGRTSPRWRQQSQKQNDKIKCTQ